jgi:hypothetical protein
VLAVLLQARMGRLTKYLLAPAGSSSVSLVPVPRNSLHFSSTFHFSNCSIQPCKAQAPLFFWPWPPRVSTGLAPALETDAENCCTGDL